MVRLFLVLIITLCLACACSLPKKQETQPSLASVVKNPLTPEETQEMLTEVGQNWLYGEGLGDTAITAGTVVVFPPYALWLVSNAVLTLSGYEPLSVANALPPAEKESWTQTYGSIASGPGRFAAAVAGREFRTQETSRERLQKYLERAAAQKRPGGSSISKE